MLKAAIEALHTPAREIVKREWRESTLPPLAALHTREQWEAAALLIARAGGTVENHTRDDGPDAAEVIEAETVVVEEDEDDVYATEQGFINRHTGEIIEGGLPFGDDVA